MRPAGQLSESGTLALALLGALVACGGEQPPEARAPAPSPPTASAGGVASPPASAPVDTGKDCVKAEGRCAGGTCEIKVKNDCDQPVRCELQVTATCETQDGTATANAGDHATVAAHEGGDLAVQATCNEGRVVRTEVGKLGCR